MKTSRKAILLSALVLPGLGQITLKRYKLGIAILVTVTLSIYRMMSIVMQQADAALNKLMLQGGVLDMQAISSAAEQSAGGTSYDLYLWFIIACWLISLVDIGLARKKTTL